MTHEQIPSLTMRAIETLASRHGHRDSLLALLDPERAADLPRVIRRVDPRSPRRPLKMARVSDDVSRILLALLVMSINDPAAASSAIAGLWAEDPGVRASLDAALTRAEDAIDQGDPEIATIALDDYYGLVRDHAPADGMTARARAVERRIQDHAQP